MNVKRVIVGELEENCYVVSKNLECIIIDPGDEKDKIIEEVGNLKVKGILITHHHFDHIGALKEIEEHYHVKENESIPSFQYEVIKNPGHTMDSISFYFPELNAIFVGDFIFEGGIGRVDLGGNEEEMKKSLRVFLNRFQNVTIYPGHGNATNIEKERKFLNYFAG